jgi:type IX secretion system PorP/SprF family membrane protein
MRNCIYVLLGIQFFIYSNLHAQNYAVYNSYYVNQYLYNPAEAATEHTYIFVNHRQQWLTFQGAPSLTTFTFNTLLNETRAGSGVKASSFKRGLLTTTDFSLSYAYGFPISDKSYLFFGLSGGAISNSIDVTNVDLNDPAISNYLVNNIQPASNFGVILHSATGINLGVSLPQLFTPKFNSTANFENTAISPIDNVIVSFYFKRKVKGKIVSRTRKGVRSKVRTDEAYAPLEFYTLYKFSKIGTSQFEAMGKLNLSQSFWLGASYRQAYGFAGSIGLTISKFLLSYSYEPGNQPEPSFSKGTHEMQLGLRLGKTRKFRRADPVFRSTLKAALNEQHSARFQHKDENPDEIHQQQSVKKKYYVVIRSFADFTSADTYKKKLIEQKYNANVFYNENDKKYYVHVFESSKSAEAHEEARNLKHYSKLKEARVLTITITVKEN